mmetsp:Transcript_52802/g.155966  ORF Transcript_52802/g.155966 Transcript_52802/m.155966 type:complete len:84 (+) Transcript_52802:355-606(+)
MLLAAQAGRQILPVPPRLRSSRAAAAVLLVTDIRGLGVLGRVVLARRFHFVSLHRLSVSMMHMTCGVRMRCAGCGADPPTSIE